MAYKDRMTLKLGGFGEVTDQKTLDKIVKESDNSDGGPDSPSYIDSRRRVNQIRELMEQKIKQNFMKPIQTEMVDTVGSESKGKEQQSSVHQSQRNENLLQTGFARKNTSYFKSNQSS